ncbi:MAG: FtsQ-type POTRA domain-containing protein [Treponema sp.]|nr:FtsQ-type POTRA domain-containing protein [Treponema sp.]
MNSNYAYITSEDLPSAKKSASKIEKGLKKFLIIAVIIFTAELIWLFGISPFIPFSTIEVHEFSGLQRADILYLAGIDDTSSFISTNTKEIRQKLSANILVESAVVMKRFPDKLSIFLTPRKASAVVLANRGTRQVPVYVDRQGVFFKVGESGSHEGTNLPILSGIENPQLNMRLPSALVPLVENLSEIATASPELLSAISEIRIERKTWDGFDLVLFPVHTSIRVRVENNLTEDTLRYMLVMLNVFEKDIQRPVEIDFRSGMGSYKIKEQSL